MSDKPLWSILICTLARREEKFLKLADKLLKQIEASPYKIEVVGLQNAGEDLLAQYRERLLRDAKGEYLCFIDDDDLIADNYVEVLGEVMTSRNPDVIAFGQFCTGTGANLTLFGLGYEGFPLEPVPLDRQGTSWAYVRPFSHVQPVRSSIARQGSFLGGPGYTGEDYAYVARVLAALKIAGSHEVRLPDILYSYLWNKNDTTQDGPIPQVESDAWADHKRPVIDSPAFRWYGE